MGESKENSVLSGLVDLSKIDGRIAVRKAVLKEAEAERDKRNKAFSVLYNEKKRREELLAEKKAACSREEKAVKHEREKINERRAALNTLSNYKLQQAAEREIDYVSKQIGQREDLLLNLMRDIEGLERKLEEVLEIVRGAEAEQVSFDSKITTRISEAQSEIETLSALREKQAQDIEDKQTLVIYNRLVARFPLDPIVEVVNRESCKACFMKLGPQVPVQIARGDMVKCPGCGRLLKLPADSE